MDIEKSKAEFEKSECFKRFEGVLQYTFFDFGTYCIRTDVPRDVEKKIEKLVSGLIFSWKAWKEAKAQAVPEGFVLVEKKNTEDWYLDEDEGMWMDHDGIDGSLCELGVGEVQAVEHKEYLITESNTLYAAKVWDYANDQVDCWQFFKTQEEAEKAAAHCKAKFNDEPIEAQEQKG